MRGGSRGPCSHATQCLLTHCFASRPPPAQGEEAEARRDREEEGLVRQEGEAAEVEIEVDYSDDALLLLRALAGQDPAAAERLRAGGGALGGAGRGGTMAVDAPAWRRGCAIM
jgi:hypothetical protein